MFVTKPRLMMLACLLSPTFLWPSSSWALGLGEIHLNSALNEPMKAEIDLIAATPDELAALRASLAGRDAFTRYGIDRPPFLSTLTFKVGKGKDGRDALLVRSVDAIPEPFVTFLVEVNWARGRLMREYTVLLDPPVYTPGETASSAAPVTAATVGAASASAPAHRTAPAPAAPPVANRGPAASQSAADTAPAPAAARSGSRYQVAEGDTLAKIARTLRADLPGGVGKPADVDQTMMALYRANPDAFGGNINILRRGTVLRVPGADEVAALNQSEATGEVRRQMDAWRSASGGEASGHLRLVTPSAGGGATGTTGTGAPGTGNANAGNGEAQALRDRVKDLEGQLAESHRLIDIRNSELSALQRKLGVAPAPASAAPIPAPTNPAPSVGATPPAPAAAPPVSTVTPAPPADGTSAPAPAPAPAVLQKKPVVAPAASESWIDWIAANWWVPAAVIIGLFVVLVFAAWRRRQAGTGDLYGMEATDVADFRDPTAKIGSMRKGDDSFVVEESGEHRLPEFDHVPDQLGDTHSDIKSPDDTMSSESAVNLDQGDPLAEADFHMAYGLYDQAADLVRIALEREPDRRDLRLKLLEIYFVWGNKDAFLQTAKGLEATRDRAPAGEWDKIVIMGKQICPDDPLFASSAGSGRGAGALVDLNLEGGENRVDIDLFGDPEGERRLDHPLAKESDDSASTTGESPSMRAGADLDFTLDAPERGADESPTREMAPRDEPTVESELLFMDAPTMESPALKTSDLHDRISSKLGPANPEQTAEVSIDDLGLNLDQFEETGAPSISQLEETGAPSISHLEETDHPADAPTMVAGLDDKSRRMMAEAESRSRDRDLTELERELEASFIADLDSGHDDVKTTVLGPESAPTVQMPREFDPNSTSRFKSPEFSDILDPEKVDVDSTSRLRGLSGDSIDLDLDRLANALGSGDTVEQPRAEDEMFSTEVFEASQGSPVDLDVGDVVNGTEAPTNKLRVVPGSNGTAKLKTDDLEAPEEMEPVTMSEVGTKLDLARAYMDMGDPEGARSILEEVVTEGSASQKQEAQRLIEALPG
ncbi:MAG: pilus assembly protein FimV [Gammaproteobacteria bacterium]|jgi:pilus assembly protein FimV|nr:pilus assembly protein FimV [Gammaproteobacteria bacterium]